MKLCYLFAFFLLCAVSSAVSAEVYCQQQASPCLKQCCPDIGGTWDAAQQDCVYPEKESETLEDMLNGPCGSCAQEMFVCLSNYEEGGTPEPYYPQTGAPSSGCCGSAALLAFLGAGMFLRRQ